MAHTKSPFFAFLAVFITLSGAALAGPTVTVNPAQSADPVCDPAISTMLKNAGSAQASADLDIINGIITPPTASLFDLGCYAQVRQRFTGSNEIDPNQTCDAMAQVYSAAQANALAKAGTQQPNAGKFDDIAMMSEVTAPLSTLASLGKADKCHPGIPTGVKIGGLDEIVCPNPGCFPKQPEDNKNAPYICSPYK